MTWKHPAGAAVAFVRSLAVVGVFLAGPALAQTLGQGGGVEVQWWRVVGAFLLCIALAGGAAYVIKTRFRGVLPVVVGGQRRLHLVETLRLSHQVDICLFTCDGRQIVVATSPHGAVMVSGEGVVAKPTDLP